MGRGRAGQEWPLVAAVPVPGGGAGVEDSRWEAGRQPQIQTRPDFPVWVATHRHALKSSEWVTKSVF